MEAHRVRGLVVALAAGLLVSVLTGCAGYQLRGRVVEGPYNTIEVVSADDPRLTDHQPLPGAALRFTIDPDSLGREPAGQAVSGEDGTFAKPIDEFGAGFLMYDVQVVAQRGGSQTAVQTISLPGSGKRLLIMLTPGEDDYKAPKDIVNDTMDMGKDYLEGRQ